MISLRQLQANRRNALKSTGPVTADGKAAVARNALKHGLFTEALLAEGEDAQQLEAHRAKYLADINPQNYAEEILAERIISATWRLRRLTEAEQHLHQSVADAQRHDLARNGTYPGEEQDRAHKAAQRGLKEKMRLDQAIDKRRRDWAHEQTCPAGLTLAIAMDTVERWSRYEKRLEGTMHRAWRELRMLRKERSAKPAPPPEWPSIPPEQSRLTEPPSENVQNKAISPLTDDTREICAAATALPIKPVSPVTPPNTAAGCQRDRSEL